MIEEEECLVLVDGTADRVTELVPGVRILGPSLDAIEPVSRTAEPVPAAEFVGIAMESVGAALGDHVDDGAGVTAVFRIEVIGDDAEFLGRFRIRAEHSA